MKTLRIIFVDQLSSNNPVLDNLDSNDFLLFYEPMSTFYEIKHHKHKITLLISSLRQLAETIKHERILHKKIDKLLLSYLGCTLEQRKGQ